MERKNWSREFNLWSDFGKYTQQKKKHTIEKTAPHTKKKNKEWLFWSPGLVVRPWHAGNFIESINKKVFGGSP